MSTVSTLHIPLDAQLRKDFTAKAAELGFDSAQAYIRVMIKAAVDNRKVDFNVDTWGKPTAEAAARLQAAALDARQNRGLSKPSTSVDDFMKGLHAEADSKK